MGMVRCYFLFCMLLLSCNKGGNFTPPIAELTNPGPPATPGSGSPGGGGPGSGAQQITLLNTTTVHIGTSSSSAGNLVYDGNRLLLTYQASPVISASQVIFEYFGVNLSSQGSSVSTYPSIQSYAGISNQSVGMSSLFWSTSGAIGMSGNLSVRNNSDGTLQSTIAINFASFGCNTIPVLTYGGGLYYGACDTFSGPARLFSFNNSGVLQSAVTLSDLGQFNSIRAITLYNGNSLIIVTQNNEHVAGNGFYKYGLNFSRQAVDLAGSGAFSAGLTDITGIATDGAYLYFSGRYNASDSTFMIGKASLGSLQ